MTAKHTLYYAAIGVVHLSVLGRGVYSQACLVTAEYAHGAVCISGCGKDRSCGVSPAIKPLQQILSSL